MSAYSFSRESRAVPFVNTEHRHIHTEIPAPGAKEILERLDVVESRSMHGQLPIVWDHALDHYVADNCGNMFLDFTSGIFVANVGHSNLAVVEAVREAMNIEPLHSYAYATEIRAKYLERLTQWSGFEKAFLLSSGTEATEAALKLIRMRGQKLGKRRPGILCIDGNWHGRTMGAQLMSSNAAQKAWIGFDDPSITHFPFPTQEILTIRQQTAAEFFRDWLPRILAAKGIDARRDFCGVMLEAFQGWSAWFYPPDFVQEIEKWCRENSLLLCFDEMQAGFARTGRKFGYEHYAVKPDLICVGKGMGGGLPLSGVLGRAEILDLPEVGNMSSTHGGNPLCCAAGLAVIDEIERLDLVNETARKEMILFPALANLRLSCWSRVTGFWGHGLIAAVHFDSAELASRVAERCMEKGVLVVHTGRESIKLGPPLTIPDAALIEGVEVIAEAIKELA